MSRTRRNIPYKHYWGQTKKELRKWIDEYPTTLWSANWIERLERDYLLHGTESRNHAVGTHEYFNRANRVGRRVARDQLRPQNVQDENFDFDDSHYRRKVKSVWWEIY